MITDLKSSCLAAGRNDLAYQLVIQLQNALDALKHGVSPDPAVIADIRQQVPQAPWLRFKDEARISDLPLHLDVSATDRIGKLYNHVRKEIEDLLASKLPIEEFKGLITGESVTRAMFDECRYVNSVYAAVVGKLGERQARLKSELEQAHMECEAMRTHPDKELRKQKIAARKRAQSAYYFGEELARRDMKTIISFVRVWAGGKRENRMAWLEALHRVASNGHGSGSILFHAFPQELVNKLAERTGGKAVRVALPDVEGLAVRTDWEGRSFLVEQVDGREKESFLFQFKDGRFSFEQTMPGGRQNRAPAPLVTVRG
jgi:hypothetical protein